MWDSTRRRPSLPLLTQGLGQRHARWGLHEPSVQEGGKTSKAALLLEHCLKGLKLLSFPREYEKLATQCAAEGVDHPQYLLRLAELELIDRHQPMVKRRIRTARFPVKSLDTLDFPAIPSLNKALEIWPETPILPKPSFL